MDLSDVWARERTAHNRLAEEMEIGALLNRPLEGFAQRMVDRAGNLRGLRVLDAGCGQGDLTMYLLGRGASVTALDISEGMARIVRERAAAAYGDAADLTIVVAPFERSGLPDEAFDLVLGVFFLHHISLDLARPELLRILSPGGRAIFYENSAANPLLNFARKHVAGRWGVPRYGTVDEHPLTPAEIQELGSPALRVEVSHPDFVFLDILNRQVLRFRYRRTGRVLRQIDKFVERRGGPLRRYSFRCTIELVRVGVTSEP